MRSSKSFANEYGITQKNVANNPSLGMGLNPNLNIEDEYIENLLKQTHFLNMEIKLVKQKQKQNKGMGIMGILNKDQSPVVTHAISSNVKYADMKNNLSLKVNTAEVQYIRLDDQNYAVKAQRQTAEKLCLKQEQKNIQNKLFVDQNLGENRQKLNECLKRLKQMRDEHRKTLDNNGRIYQEWEQSKSKTRTKNLMKEINQNLEQQSHKTRQEHFTAITQKLKNNQSKLDEADKQFKQDPEYKKLVEQNNELKDKLKKTDKQLFDSNYKAKQMEDLRKLSVRNKDVEAELKKQAVEESERLKKKLTDKKEDLNVKIKESKNGLQSNDQIRLLRGKMARRDKEISDLKKKCEVSENNFKRLRDEVTKLTEMKDDKIKENKSRELRLNELKAVLNEVSTDLRTAELDHEKNQSDLTTSQGNLKDIRKRLQGLQQENSYLSAKEEYLTREVDVDEGIKSVKIEQLGGLMHSNSGLNDTITDLMGKWQQIIKFSREAP